MPFRLFGYSLDTMKPLQRSPKRNWKNIILTGPDWPADLTIPQEDQLPEDSEVILESSYTNEIGRAHV